MGLKLVASLGGPDISSRARQAAALGADFVEIRADLLDQPAAAPRIAAQIKKSLPLGIILTVRDPLEAGTGGSTTITLENRMEIMEKSSEFVDMVDIELRNVTLYDSLVQLVAETGKKLIISFHSFDRFPEDLSNTLDCMKQHSPHFRKVAVRCGSKRDVSRLASLARGENDLILIPMGEEYTMDRVFLAGLGSGMVYCSLGRATAPGQVTLEQAAAVRNIFENLAETPGTL